MKVRMGFVSNSSSSSFCILGLTQTELERYLPNMEETDDFNITDYIEDKVNDNSELCYESGIEKFCDDYVIGFDVYNLDKNKTINQSKQELKEKLDEIFNIDINLKDIGFRVDGGYDG